VRVETTTFAAAIALGGLVQFSKLAGRCMRGWRREAIELFTLLAMLAIVKSVEVDIWVVAIILVIHFARVLGNNAGIEVGRRVARKVGSMYLEGHQYVTPRAALRQLIREAIGSAKPVTRNRLRHEGPSGGPGR
jgi:hypothetical protein